MIAMASRLRGAPMGAFSLGTTTRRQERKLRECSVYRPGRSNRTKYPKKTGENDLPGQKLRLLLPSKAQNCLRSRSLPVHFDSAVYQLLLCRKKLAAAMAS
jgi:hypothetical protein